MKHIHLIYNPTAGKGNATLAIEKIKAWAKKQSGLQLSIHTTENVGHATSLARDLSTTTTPVTIFVLGGDGTVNEVLNGINNFDLTTIGILPFGSGNDFVKAIGIVKPSPEQLMEAYVNNPQVKKIDFLLLNDKYRAINEVGLGMSAEVIAMRNKMKHFKPKTQYKIAAVVRALFWKPFKYEVSIDGCAPSTIKSMWFTINNGTTVGGGMVTAKNAKVDDGKISVMFLKNFNRFKTLYVLSKCKKGKVSELKECGLFVCKELDIETNDVSVEFDGNLIDHQNHINVKIIPNKLKLLVLNK